MRHKGNWLGLAILIGATVGCSVIKVERTYDATGITSEKGYALGFYDESAGKFSMLRRDQRGPTEYIEETAGAEATWTHEAGRQVTSEALALAAQVIAAYLATKAPVAAVPVTPAVTP